VIILKTLFDKKQREKYVKIIEILIKLKKLLLNNLKFIYYIFWQKLNSIKQCDITVTIIELIFLEKFKANLAIKMLMIL
jgi:hypothetical protein